MIESDLIVISSYPEKGITHGKGTVGVASYTKNTLLALSVASKGKFQITVLAESLFGVRKEYQEDNIHVIRCWQRNNWLSYWQIFKEIRKIKAQKILIEFEMAMLGSPLINTLFPMFLLILRTLNKETIVVLHQVLLDFSSISGHLGEREGSIKSKGLSILAGIFFWLVIKLANCVIVFEEFLKRRLAQLTNTKNVAVIPHGVELPQGKKISQVEARRELGIDKSDFILATFGFLAWYKGTDWLVDTVTSYLDKNKASKLKLLIVGGPNPNHLGKKFYQAYINDLKMKVQKYSLNTRVTGFIKEDDIPLYYQAADILIFPYRTAMSSSGPLSLAFTYRKPFLISHPLAEILKTQDIAKLMNNLDLKSKDLSFLLKEDGFWGKIENTRHDPQLKERMARLGQQINHKRSWSKIGKIYYQLLSLY